MSFVTLLNTWLDVNSGNSWQIQANLWKFLIFYFSHFFKANISMWSRGDHLTTVFSVKIFMTIWIKVKTICFVIFIPTLIHMPVGYKHVYQHSTQAIIDNLRRNFWLCKTLCTSRPPKFHSLLVVSNQSMIEQENVYSSDQRPSAAMISSHLGFSCFYWRFICFK